MISLLYSGSSTSTSSYSKKSLTNSKKTVTNHDISAFFERNKASLFNSLFLKQRDCQEVISYLTFSSVEESCKQLTDFTTSLISRPIYRIFRASLTEQDQEFLDRLTLLSRIAICASKFISEQKKFPLFFENVKLDAKSYLNFWIESRFLNAEIDKNHLFSPKEKGIIRDLLFYFEEKVFFIFISIPLEKYPNLDDFQLSCQRIVEHILTPIEDVDFDNEKINVYFYLWKACLQNFEIRMKNDRPLLKEVIKGIAFYFWENFLSGFYDKYPEGTPLKGSYRNVMNSILRLQIEIKYKEIGEELEISNGYLGSENPFYESFRKISLKTSSEKEFWGKLSPLSRFIQFSYDFASTYNENQERAFELINESDASDYYNLSNECRFLGKKLEQSPFLDDSLRKETKELFKYFEEMFFQAFKDTCTNTTNSLDSEESNHSYYPSLSDIEYVRPSLNNLSMENSKLFIKIPEEDFKEEIYQLFNRFSNKKKPDWESLREHTKNITIGIRKYKLEKTYPEIGLSEEYRKINPRFFENSLESLRIEKDEQLWYVLTPIQQFIIAAFNLIAIIDTQDIISYSTLNLNVNNYYSLRDECLSLIKKFKSLCFSEPEFQQRTRMLNIAKTCLKSFAEVFDNAIKKETEK